MTADRWQQVERLYHEAASQRPSQRQVFLDCACAGDQDLRGEVERMLSGEAAAGEFLQVPAAEVAARALARERIAPGTRIGPYAVVSLVGAGGMGEVYKARDTRLNRTVAIKVLPLYTATDAASRKRLLREAQAASALNHPNIVTVYDVVSADTRDSIVMEYVEGRTLAETIGRNALPVGDVLDYGIQIADALAAAHAAGIIHLDLKPGNIVITNGAVKVLDFGLAKFARPSGMPSLASETRTAENALAGTLSYMSPERLEGKEADARADIWALGCVLHEALSGKAVFAGDTSAAIVSAVMKEEPAALGNVAPAVERIVTACLAKDPEQRFQSARDLKRALAWVTEAEEVVPARRRPHAIRWVLAALVAVAALAFALLRFREPPSPLQLTRLAINPPENTSFGQIAISPDGRRLAFTDARLWIRELDQEAAHPLDSTEGARSPFWSPDGRWVGFFAGGKLKKIAASGGIPQVLATAPEERGGAWSRDHVIVFQPDYKGPLQQIPDSGGDPKAVTELDRSESSHRWPHFLPDGRHFLYSTGYSKMEFRAIYLGSLDSNKRLRLVDSEASGAYAAISDNRGYLLFLRQGSLLAHVFNAKTFQTVGDPVPVASPVGVRAGFEARFSVSNSGILLYQSTGSAEQDLAWLDRGGNRVGVIGPTASYHSVEVSPDGQKAAAALTDRVSQNTSIWLFDVNGRSGSRFTFIPLSISAFPIWSPDRTRIVFTSSRDGTENLYQKPADGAGEEELLLRTDGNKRPSAWSPDGRWVLYSEYDPKTQWDLWLLPMQGEHKPMPFSRQESDEQWGRFSPDGKWIAYQSNETGRDEIWVRGFSPGNLKAGGKWLVSVGGGADPRWRADGKELFYLAPDRSLMAVPVKSGKTFERGSPQTLFRTQALLNAEPSYAVTPDGRRFLIRTARDQAASATVVLNWTAGLKQ